MLDQFGENGNREEARVNWSTPQVAVICKNKKYEIKKKRKTRTTWTVLGRFIVLFTTFKS